jgi:peptidoglycan/xylan/chitin deacetylase (PgdA/CDA1 family)
LRAKRSLFRRWQKAVALLLFLLVLVPASMQLVHLIHNAAYSGISPICRVDTPHKTLALTFDDGPSATYTQQVLALLKKYGDHATFFLLGSSVSSSPRLVEAEVSAGMAVGNHTWDHPNLNALTTAQAMAEIGRTQTELTSLGLHVSLFRAPYGYVTAPQLQSIEASGFQPVHWAMALDHYVGGLGLSASQAATAMLKDLRPGDIILAHDAPILPKDGGGLRTTAMQTLSRLLPALRDRGYHLVTVSELLRSGEPVLAAPRAWFWETGFTCP